EMSLLVREMNPDQRVVLLLNDPQFAQMLREAANVRLALSVPAMAAPAFIAGLYGDRVLSVLLLRGGIFAVIDLLIHPEDTFAGQAVRALAIDYHVLPVLVLRGGRLLEHPLNARLAPGDRLVALVALADLERLLRRQPSSAAFAVDVTSFLLPARGYLAGLVR